MGWVINGDDIGLDLSSMVICFDFRSTNVVHLSNQNPCFYQFRCHHPLITQLNVMKRMNCILLSNIIDCPQYNGQKTRKSMISIILSWNKIIDITPFLRKEGRHLGYTSLTFIAEWIRKIEIIRRKLLEHICFAPLITVVVK